MFTLLAFICALLSACHSFMSAGSSRPATDETTHAATSTAGAASRCVTPPPSAVAHSSAFRLHGSPQRAEYKTPPRGGTALGRAVSESKDPIDGTAASIGTPLVLTRTPSYAPVRELTFETEETATHHHKLAVGDDDKDITDALAEAGVMPQGSPDAGVSEKPTLRDSTVDTALATPTDAAAFVGRLFSPSTGRSTPRTPTFSARRPVSVLGRVGGAGTATPSPDSPGSLATDAFTSTDIVHWFIHHVLQYAQELTATAETTRASAEKHDLYDSLLHTFIPLCNLIFAVNDATDDLSIKVTVTALTEALGILQRIEWGHFVELCINPRAAWRSHELIRTASAEALSIITVIANLICAHKRNIQLSTIVHAIILHALSLIPDVRISLETIAADTLKEAFLQVFMPLYQTERIDAASLETYVNSTITAFNKIISLAPRIITSDLKKKTLSLLMNHYYTKAHLRTNIALCKRIITSCRDTIDVSMATRYRTALDKTITDAALYTAADKTYHQMLTQELISVAQALDPSYGSGTTYVFVNHLHILSPTAEITPGSTEYPAAAKVGGGHVMTDELRAACDRAKKYAYIFDNDTNETPLGIGSSIVSVIPLNSCKLTDTFEIEYIGRAFNIFASDTERGDNRDEISRDTKRSSLLFGRGLQGERLFQCIDILVNEALSGHTTTAAEAAASSSVLSGRTTAGTPATGGGCATGGSGTRESSLPDIADLAPRLLRREVTLRDGCDFVRVAADIVHASPTVKSDVKDLKMASRIVLECRLEESTLIPLRIITLHPLHMAVATDLKSLVCKLKDKPDSLSAIKFTDLATKAASPSKGGGHSGGAKSPAKGKRGPTPGATGLVDALCYSNPEILLSPVRGIDERVLMVITTSDRA